MKKLKNFTLAEYLKVLSDRTPTPGGGSVAALTAALAVGLLCMVTEYSLGKGKPKRVETKLKNRLKEFKKMRMRLLELVDLDAEAYKQVVKARKKSAKEKRKAKTGARKVPREIANLCKKAVNRSSFLVDEGNSYLLSDVAVAVELLLSAFNSAMINVEINQ